MSSENPQGTPPPAPTPEKPTPDLAGEIPKEARQMAMLAHLLGALIGIIGAVIIWLVKKDDHPFIDDQGKEATNFHITLLIGYVATTIIGVLLSCITFGLSTFLPVVVLVVQVVFGIIGALKANEGEYYRYPFAIRLIK